MSRLMNLPLDGASLNLAGLIALVEAADHLASVSEHRGYQLGRLLPGTGSPG